MQKKTERRIPCVNVNSKESLCEVLSTKKERKTKIKLFARLWDWISLP
jgi:hypothetical protein